MADPRRFEVRDELGKGAFGSVYLAEMTSTSGFAKVVALKVLHPEWTQRADMTQRLRDEARLLGRLRHPNIVAVDDLLQVDGQWAVVMEYVAGDDLEALVHRARGASRPIPIGAIAGVAESVARALHAAWSSPGRDGRPLRVVHRDIKPSNIRITPEGAVKVLDFGIAASTLDGSAGDLARAGSPAYMAPERLHGRVDGPEGDVYALGATIYELAAGTLFGRVAEAGSPVEDAPQHAARLAEAVARVVAQRGPAAEGLARLVERCLAYAPADRPTAQEVADEARRIGRVAEDADLVGWARAAVEERTVAATSRSLTMIESVRSGDSDTMILDDLGGDAESVLLTETVDDRPALTATPSPTPVPTLPPPVAEGRPSGGWRALALGAALVAAAGAWWISRPAPTPVVAAPPSVPAEVAPTVPPVAVPVIPAPPAAPSVTTPGGVASASRPRPPDGRAPAPRPDRPPDAGVGAPTAGTAAVVAPPADAPRVRAVKVTVPGAESVACACGDVDGAGASSVNLRNVPVGRCVVRAVLEGRSLEGVIDVDAPRGWTCVAGTGGLTCS